MQNRIKFFFFISLFAASLLGTACKHYPEVVPTTRACSPDTVYFQNQVLPILVSNCAMSGCHDANSHKEGVNLTSYAKVMSTGGVKAGNSGDSELYSQIVSGEMPPSGNLSAAQMALIEKWISQGALNLACVDACDTLNVTYTSTISSILQNNCNGCHSGASPSGNIDLSTYNGVKTVALNGRLYGSVSFTTGYKAMPQSGNKLPDCQIIAIDKWIKAGAPQN